MFGDGMIQRMFALTADGFTVDRALAFDAEQLPVHADEADLHRRCCAPAAVLE
jgi:hypothetical protein